jgi:cytochrome c oxidase cbb3-type subunit I/II
MATVGILLYMVAMWASGVNQGLMWRATNPDGTLTYPNFVETLLAIRPMYIARFVGGSLYLVGFGLMVWNLWKTARAGKPVDAETTVVVEPEAVPAGARPGLVAVLTGWPLVFGVSIIGVSLFLGWGSPRRFLVLTGVIVALGAMAFAVARRQREAGKPSWFALVEGRPLAFTVLTLVAILIGGVAELLPTILVKQAVPHHGEGQQPYSPLELQGRDVYVREGCYVCHSQMIRPFVAETQRYGDVSRAEEFIYDHPFQWGSKRTGPDLHRVGGKYPNLWHYTHLMDPRATSPGSNMPAYGWLAENTIDVKAAPKKLALMQKLGVPYTHADVDGAELRQKAQAETVVADLAAQGVQVAWDSEMVAIVSYLQRLGRGPQDLPKPGPNEPVSSVKGGE